MKLATRTAILLVMFTVVAFVFLAGGGSQETTDHSRETLAIDAKVLMVYQGGADVKFALIIERGSFKQIGNKLFLVGTHIDSGNPGEWMRGLTVAINWDSVNHLIVFDSVEDLNKRSGAAERETR